MSAASTTESYFESSSSSCSSSPPTSSLKIVHHPHETDSGCGSDDDPTLALKINKGLSMGYDYELIKSVIDQQNDGDDMSKFIETMVRTAELHAQSLTPSLPSSKSTSPTTFHSKSTTDIDSACSDPMLSHDVYVIDGADLAYSANTFSWRAIEIAIKYLHSHGHKKVFVALPYSLKHHRHDQAFLESKSLRDLERKNMLLYTNRLGKQTNKPGSFTHISEMLKFAQKTKGYLITNVSLKDFLLDFTIYKQILEERVIRYRFQSENFQPLLVTIVSGDDGNDCETHYPLCPYGKKCTYGSKCKYYHIERRHQHSLSITDTLQMKARAEKSKFQQQSSSPSMNANVINQGFYHTKSGPEQLYMYNSSVEQSLVDDARAAYEYGLPSVPISTEFSFVDQRMPVQTARPPAHHHQSWFGVPSQPQPFFNRTFSAPQQPNNEMAAAMAMQQQQQNWARQQQQQQQQNMFPMPQQPQPIEQNVLRFLSMMSVQQQNVVINPSNNLHLSPMSYYPSVQRDHPYDSPSVNSQDGLADKIQAVRHLWESENVSPSLPFHSTHYHPMASLVQATSHNTLP